MNRQLLLCTDEGDMFGWLERHPDRKPDMVIWPGRFWKLHNQPAFSRLAVTAEAWYLEAAVAACLTRVKGPDGLTPGQRLCADEVGARMRGAS
jgi:hypothetical protein